MEGLRRDRELVLDRGFVGTLPDRRNLHRGLAAFPGSMHVSRDLAGQPKDTTPVLARVFVDDLEGLTLGMGMGMGMGMGK